MRLIDADALWRLVMGFRDTAPEETTKRKYTCNAILMALLDERETPTIEAEPVKHSQWKYYHKQGKAVCMNCSFERNLDDNFGRAVACPNCGAIMDGGEAE